MKRAVYSIQEFYKSNGAVPFHKMTNIYLQINDEEKDKSVYSWHTAMNRN
ncbi:MAG: hypothetical protein ACJAZV_001128 [Roseivirga sp.]|jgi:hypothetical protein